MKVTKTPKELGYRMPAEWERHEATWMVWPKDPISFPDNIRGETEKAFVEMMRVLAEYEKVHLLVDDCPTFQKVDKMLSKAKANKKNVDIHRISTADVWTRDYGPSFVKRAKQDGSGEELLGIWWNYTAYGWKYEDLLPDRKTGGRILQLAGIPAFKPGIDMEGGSVDVNGCGLGIITKESLLYKKAKRNPRLSAETVEQKIKDSLGLHEILWLPKGLYGDDTDGHVDNVARFTNPSTVLCPLEKDRSDSNYRRLMENYYTLRDARPGGKKLDVVTLPMAGMVEYLGSEIKAGYANFYIANQVVLVPTYGHKNDNRALGIIREQFPGRKTVGLPSRAIVVGGGGPHCATQQQPFC